MRTADVQGQVWPLTAFSEFFSSSRTHTIEMESEAAWRAHNSIIVPLWCVVMVIAFRMRETQIWYTYKRDESAMDRNAMLIMVGVCFLVPSPFHPRSLGLYCQMRHLAFLLLLWSWSIFSITPHPAGRIEAISSLADAIWCFPIRPIKSPDTCVMGVYRWNLVRHLSNIFSNHLPSRRWVFSLGISKSGQFRHMSSGRSVKSFIRLIILFIHIHRW